MLWIKVAAARLLQIFYIMMWKRKPSNEAAAPDGDTGRETEPAKPRGTVPAAWPNGASQLAIAEAACQSCTVRAVCGILFGHTQPNPITHPPAFCPYAAEVVAINRQRA